MCKRKVNSRRQPLDSKSPRFCPTAGSACSTPRSPRLRPPRLPESRRKGQRLPQTNPHKNPPITFRRLPWRLTSGRLFCHPIQSNVWAMKSPCWSRATRLQPDSSGSSHAATADAPVIKVNDVPHHRHSGFLRWSSPG